MFESNYFECARHEISDDGVFTEDQSFRLRQMLNMIEIAIERSREKPDD